MNRKKLPLAVIILLGLCLATVCIGGAWLIAASVADPALFEKVTTPVVEFVGEQVDKVEAQVQKAGEAWDKGVANSKYFFQEKQESLSLFFDPPEEEVEAEPLVFDMDDQVFQDSLLSSPRDQADYDITHFELDEFTQVEQLMGGSRPLIYFNQTDPQWGNYGSDSISGYGCGPTSMAMVVSTLCNRHIDPQEMADIFVEQGYWANKSGTYYQFGIGSGEIFGLEVVTLLPEETTAGDLMQYLLGDSLMIALVSKGHFTNGGHYIVLRGATLSGDILVADPASRERSLTTWDPQLILDELSASRYHGAPLWVFTALPE